MKMKKFSTLFLTATIVLSMLPATMASSSTSKEVLVYPISEPYQNHIKGFNDIANDPAKADIEYLLGRDIVMGYNNQAFRPAAHLTQAEAMTLLTKAFNLNMDEQVTKPDQGTVHSESSKWYSDAYLAAQHSGVVLSKDDIMASDTVTREQFASWIIDQLDRIDVYPVIKMYIHIEDSEQISAEYAYKVQTLLLTRLATLAEDQKFRPQAAITRAEASQWISEAVKFADNLKANKEGQLTANLPFAYEAKKPLSNAEAITLLTKALLDGEGTSSITGEQLEQAYPNLDSDEWYSQYYLQAINGEVSLASDVKANDTVTREQFAGWIIDQFDRIGPYPVIMMYLHIADEESITPELSNKIQLLLLTKITELNEAGQFRPKDAITGEEAVAWLNNAAEFAAQLKANVLNEGQESSRFPYTVSEQAIDDESNKININIELPHPGYDAEVSAVHYVDGDAIVDISIIEPDPEKMYPQVITEKTLTTTVKAGYDVVINF